MAASAFARPRWSSASSASVSVAVGASAALGALLCLGGCADPGVIQPAASGLSTGGASTAFVLQPGNAALLEFSVSGSGTAASAGSITLPTGFTGSALAVDAVSGVVYVGGTASGGAPEVLAYSAGANGAAAPARTITVSGSDFDVPSALATDASGQLYVASIVGQTPGVAVFSSTANGAAAPVRTVAGGSTGIYVANALAVDTSGNLFVASVDPILTPYGGSIIQFAPALVGNVPPTRAITSINTIFAGVGEDSAGNVWAAEETDNNGALSGASIVEFGATASGASPKPLRTISGASTQLGAVSSMKVDATGNVFVLNQGSSGTVALLGFGPNATGSVAPDLQLTLPGVTSNTSLLAIR